MSNDNDENIVIELTNDGINQISLLTEEIDTENYMNISGNILWSYSFSNNSVHVELNEEDIPFSSLPPSNYCIEG